MASMRGSAFSSISSSSDLAAAGHHGQQQPTHRPSSICSNWASRSFMSNLFSIRRFVLSFLAFSSRRLRLFDQGEHIAHAQDAAGHAVGVERLERRAFRRCPMNLMGLPVTPDRERRAAAGVAVRLGQDDAADAIFSLKVLATFTAS